jgi:hypothetical protein
VVKTAQDYAREPCSISRLSRLSWNRLYYRKVLISESDKVWQLVDSCRFETKTQAKRQKSASSVTISAAAEKNLTVHPAKHMDQIAMPALELVNQREVSPDAIISPLSRAPNGRTPRR